MKDASVKFVLKYEGNNADDNLIDFYDIAQALEGFQRSLALTTHLVLNGEIITQAPSLKGARIFASPPEAGSWKLAATVLAGSLYTLGTAPRDTVVGNIISSLYDYVVSESLGFHVDFDKTLGEQYEELKSKQKDVPKIENHQADALIEKCSTAIKELHRPIYKNETASRASISVFSGGLPRQIGGQLDRSTFDYMLEVVPSDISEVIVGRISSYNSNTFRGRIYVSEQGRPVVFELAENCRSPRVMKLIAESLTASVTKEFDAPNAAIKCRVFRNESRIGHLKSYKILDVSSVA